MRLPSFNDFSPVLIPDLRGMVGLFGKGFDASKLDKEILSHAPRLTDAQRRKNVIITLSVLQLIERSNSGQLNLTDIGKSVRDAPTEEAAALVMCKHIICNLNGLAILRAIDALDRSGQRINKKTLRQQLLADGITDLSNATTDHTTLANWMVRAGLLNREPKTYALSDAGMKAGLGWGTGGLAAMEALTAQQRIYIRELKRRSLSLLPDQYVLAGDIFDECAKTRPALFENQDQMRASVTEPLNAAEWLVFDPDRPRPRGRGGKGGWIRPGPTLEAIPVEELLPQYLDDVPADLRDKLSTPLAKIKLMLLASSPNERGLGLELLALRMVMDLGLKPAGFRMRASDTTGGTEVDLIAEGHLIAFTRWTFQCKHATGNVNVTQVAKEVGIATLLRSHVIVMVSTSGFSTNAVDFASGVTRGTPLQVIMLNGSDIERYVRSGADWLAERMGEWIKRNTALKRLREEVAHQAGEGP